MQSPETNKDTDLIGARLVAAGKISIIDVEKALAFQLEVSSTFGAMPEFSERLASETVRALA